MTSLVSDSRETQRILDLVEPAVEPLGLEVVRVLMTGSTRKVLQIMLDRKDGAKIGIEDCAEASRLISALLDVEDPIAGQYDLEVSSPGIDRPLTRPKDFERYTGFEARIELARPRNGRRRFRGRLLGLEADDVRLAAEGTEMSLPLTEISKAKLVMTDELVEASGRAPRMN